MYTVLIVMEMTTLLSVTVTNKPLKVGQWVRLRRGVLKVRACDVCQMFILPVIYMISFYLILFLFSSSPYLDSPYLPAVYFIFNAVIYFTTLHICMPLYPLGRGI
jgi:hypothetical protein